MKPTNLNPLFIDLMPNFAHLVTTQPQSKDEFLNTIKTNYSLGNPKINLFYLAVNKSEFETIKLSVNRDSILFNH